MQRSKAAHGLGAKCGVEGANATQDATHRDEASQERWKLGDCWLRFTDSRSVFADCAVRQIGAGEHDGLVIETALAAWRAGAAYVERPDVGWLGVAGST